MKKVLKILGVIFLAIFLLVVAVLAHAGLFESITIVERETGPYTIVYKEHLGAYHKVKPAMDEVYEGLLEMGIETYRGVGLYFDDPQEVPADQLRSEVGSILEITDLDKVDQIEETFKVKKVPHQKSVIVEFPIRNMLSYMIAPAKVYREMGVFWQEKGYPGYGYAVEIYDVPNKTITYIMPIEEIITKEIILEEPIMLEMNKIEDKPELESTSESKLKVNLEATASASESDSIKLKLETDDL